MQWTSDQGCFSVEGISFCLVLYPLQLEASSDPNVLTGTPCCPGVVEGVVRVVTSIEQTSVQDNSDSYHWGYLTVLIIENSENFDLDI